MPDGLTHVLAGYSGLGKWLSTGRMALFLTGSITPDVFLRGGSLLFSIHPESDFLSLYLMPLHTPLVSFLYCIALAQTFKNRLRKTAFLWLYAGCMLHFALDFLQRTIEGTGFTVLKVGAYHWLFPVSWIDFQFGLFWAEDMPYGLIFLIPASIWVFTRRAKQKNTVATFM